MSNSTPNDGNVSGHHQATETMPPPPEYPAGPQPHGPQQPAGPNNFAIGLRDQLTVITHLAKGQTIQAFQVTSRSPLLWLVTLIAGMVLLSILLTTATARLSGAAMSSISSFFGGSSVYFGMTAGAWFSLVFASIMVGALVMLLRAIALHLTFQLAGKPQPFRTSMSLLATSYSLFLPIMAIVLVLILIPGGTWAMIMAAIGTFLWTLFTLVAELLIYIGLNRTTGFAASPLRAHVIATGIWMIAVVIIYLLASMIVGEIAFDALGGML
ncbi:hypothetical protein [Enteractinococcus helveticum]|uniref:Yip1 domain-containing protein n=1 Tax=Enteractinococcus helveticum TaxID=1837282 RepID=A0A1B7M0E8_9MICC|nr:hypothetical protein [Enteractinococcus helveticum]OAV61558.1 hypothetical protein A6F49_08975 [Enteractinococcus helveticum]